jgi:hypothetical protein
MVRIGYAPGAYDLFRTLQNIDALADHSSIAEHVA